MDVSNVVNSLVKGNPLQPSIGSVKHVSYSSKSLYQADLYGQQRIVHLSPHGLSDVEGVERPMYRSIKLSLLSSQPGLRVRLIACQPRGKVAQKFAEWTETRGFGTD